MPSFSSHIIVSNSPVLEHVNSAHLLTAVFIVAGGFIVSWLLLLPNLVDSIWGINFLGPMCFVFSSRSVGIKENVNIKNSALFTFDKFF